MQHDEIKSYGCVAKWLRGRDETEKRFVVAKHGTELSLYLTLQPVMTGKNPTPSWGEEIAWNTLESLAATRERSEQRRVLMEKHEWIALPTGYYCHECGNEKQIGHTPDCAWDAALKDVPRKEK